MNLLNKFLGSNYEIFLKKFALVFSGTTFAQIATIAAYPLLTRLFSVDNFGIFTYFFTLMVVFSVLQSLKLQHAIVAETNPIEAFRLLFLCLLVPIFNSFFLYLIIYQFDIPFFSIVKEKELLVPVTISGLLMVFYDVGYNYLAKIGLFKKLVFLKIIQSFSIIIFQVIFGLSFVENINIPFNNGLIFGFILGQFLSFLLMITILLRVTSSLYKNLYEIGLDYYLNLLFKYKKFILLSMPAELLNSLSYFLIVYFITENYGLIYAGLYGLSQRVIMGPLNLISVSMTDVFKNFASQEIAKYNSLKKSFVLLFKLLLIVSVITFIFLASIQNMFGIIFGEEWQDVGKIVFILIPFYCFKFLSSPLSYVFFILKKQEWDLIWQFGLLIIICSIFTLTIDSYSFYQVLTIFSFSVSFYYLLNICLSYMVSK